MPGTKRGGSSTMGKQAAGKRLAETLRGRIAAVAPDRADLIIASLTEAIQTRKRGSGLCKTCGKWVEVEVQDATAATAAIKVLIEQSEGRPGVAGEDQREALKIVRFVAPDPKLLDLPLWQELAEARDWKALRPLLLAAGTEVDLPVAPL